MYLFITGTLVYAFRVRKIEIAQALQWSGVGFHSWYTYVSYKAVGIGLLRRRHAHFLLMLLRLTEVGQFLIKLIDR